MTSSSERKLENQSENQSGRFEVRGDFLLSENLTVYEIFDRKIDKPAWVWLEDASDGIEPHRERASQLRNLSHPNLLPVYEQRQSRDQRFAMLSELPGSDFVPLRTLMNGPLESGVTAQIIRQTALALDYCHKQGVLHLHLHPAFIFVGLDGTVRLSPYAAVLKPEEPPAPGEPVSPKLLRIAPYRSPEQFSPEGQPDVRSDIYSLSLIAYELLAGLNPFLAPTDAATQLLHTSKGVPPLQEYNSTVSPRLESAIATALVKNPDGRYASVLDFLAQFEAGIAVSLLAPDAAPQVTSIKKLVEQSRATAEEAATFPNTRPEISPAVENPAVLPETLPVQPLPAPVSVTPAPQPAVAVAPAATTAVPKRRKSLWAKLGLGYWLLLINMLLLLLVIWVLVNNSNTGDEIPTAGVTPYVSPILGGSAASTPGNSVSFIQPDDMQNGAGPGKDPWIESLSTADRQLFEQSDFEDAVKAYQNVNKGAPDYQAAYTRLGRALYLWDNEAFTKDAVPALKKATDLKPDDALAWSFLAMTYTDLYQYDAAQDAVTHALKINPKLPETRAAQALLLLTQDGLDQAKEALSQVAGPGSGNLWVDLAWCQVYNSSKDWSKALSLLDYWVKKYPTLARLQTIKGDLIVANNPGAYQDAANAYRLALKADNNYALAHDGLGWINYKHAPYSDAEDEFSHALAARPDLAHSMTGQGYVRLAQLNLDGASDAFNNAVQADARNSLAYNGLAEVLLARSQPDKVEAWADLAIKYNSRYDQAYYNKGRALYLLKDYNGAISAFEKAAQLAPDKPQYQESLAFAYYATGNSEKARQAAEASLKLKPDNNALSELLKTLNRG